MGNTESVPGIWEELQRNDYLCIALVLGFAVVALVITYHDGSRFYNPFV